jgi:RNA polymerase sigma factor (sigma-70 family)
MTPDDSALIQEFVANDSQTAFAEIVHRYTDFVYSAALRQVNGDSGLASDVSQSVFLDLGRKARSFDGNISLPGWLHRATRLAALAALRARERRILREHEAVRLQEFERMENSFDWCAARNVIDEVLDNLNEPERKAVLLRYFQKQTFAEISATHGITEDAARMRVDRSLEKLRLLLIKKGVTSTSAALSAALTTQSVMSAPAGLSSSIAHAAAAALARSTSTSVLTLMATAKLKTSIAVILTAGALTIATHEHQKANRLESMLKTGELQARNAAPVAPEKASAQNENELNQSRSEHLELMRLRAEVAALLKNQNAAAAPLPAAPQTKQSDEPSDPVEEANKTAALARMNYISGWGIAFMLAADENGGMMPKTFAEAAKHYPAQAAPVMSAFDPNKFEIVFNGSLKDAPPQTIIVREKNAFANGDQTGFLRTYLFADGHSELHSSPDGNFEEWEKRHMPQMPVEAANH